LETTGTKGGTFSRQRPSGAAHINLADYIRWGSKHIRGGAGAIRWCCEARYEASHVEVVSGAMSQSILKINTPTGIKAQTEITTLPSAQRLMKTLMAYVVNRRKTSAPSLTAMEVGAYDKGKNKGDKSKSKGDKSKGQRQEEQGQVLERCWPWAGCGYTPVRRLLQPLWQMGPQEERMLAQEDIHGGSGLGRSPETTGKHSSACSHCKRKTIGGNLH